jgi:hypothetical protein
MIPCWYSSCPLEICWKFLVSPPCNGNNPSSHLLSCPCQVVGTRPLSNVFHGAAIHPGTALPSSSRGLHDRVSSYLFLSSQSILHYWSLFSHVSWWSLRKKGTSLKVLAITLSGRWWLWNPQQFFPWCCRSSRHGGSQQAWDPQRLCKLLLFLWTYVCFSMIVSTARGLWP